MKSMKILTLALLTLSQVLAGTTFIPSVSTRSMHEARLGCSTPSRATGLGSGTPIGHPLALQNFYVVVCERPYPNYINDFDTFSYSYSPAVSGRSFEDARNQCRRGTLSNPRPGEAIGYPLLMNNAYMVVCRRPL